MQLSVWRIVFSQMLAQHAKAAEDKCPVLLGYSFVHRIASSMAQTTTTHESFVSPVIDSIQLVDFELNCHCTDLN